MIMPDITEISMIFADKSRAFILIELLGGARTTSELATVANIKPQTAIYHLNKMVDIGIIEKRKHGKNSYYKIKNEDIARILEKLIHLSNEPKISSLKESVRSQEIRFGRLCFDHIAGKIGVVLFNSFKDLNYIQVIGTSIIITDIGYEFFVKENLLSKEQKVIGELCNDWSEKDFHISGEFGRLLYENLKQLSIISQDIKTRKIILTPYGEEWINDTLKVNI